MVVSTNVMQWPSSLASVTTLLSLIIWTSTTLMAAQPATAFVTPFIVRSPNVKIHSYSPVPSKSWTGSVGSWWWLLLSPQGDNEDDNDDADNASIGMERAFRQLEELKSLDSESMDPDSIPKNDKNQKSSSKKLRASALGNWTATPLKSSPEQEVQLYKDMVQELESTSEEDLYSNVLEEMGGGKPRTETDESLTTSKDAPSIVDALESEESRDSENSTIPKRSSADFLNEALEEAVKEVSVKNPSAVDSILDDEDLMNEIEAIFDRGNQQLLAGLDEVRKEQKQLAQASMEKKITPSQQEQDAQARLDAAEQSMRSVLKTVNKERNNVEQAVADLKQAQEEQASKSLLMQLKRSPLKQGALIGFLLFSTRSILDSISALSDESLLTSALIQGALAIFCVAAFYML